MNETYEDAVELDEVSMSAETAEKLAGIKAQWLEQQKQESKDER